MDAGWFTSSEGMQKDGGNQRSESSENYLVNLYFVEFCIQMCYYKVLQRASWLMTIYDFCTFWQVWSVYCTFLEIVFLPPWIFLLICPVVGHYALKHSLFVSCKQLLNLKSSYELTPMHICLHTMKSHRCKGYENGQKSYQNTLFICFLPVPQSGTVFMRIWWKGWIGYWEFWWWYWNILLDGWMIAAVNKLECSKTVEGCNDKEKTDIFCVRAEHCYRCWLFFTNHTELYKEMCEYVVWL